MDGDILVGVSGGTYKYKDKIQKYAAEYGDPVVGGAGKPPARVRWDSGAKMWLMQYKVWKKLVEHYPDIERKCTMTPL